jgi:hypothetical protein
MATHPSELFANSCLATGGLSPGIDRQSRVHETRAFAYCGS